MSVLLFISDETEGLTPRARELFKMLVPNGHAYSICNVLEEWDLHGEIDRNDPCVVVAVGREVAKCLDFDGIGYVNAPDILAPASSRKACLKARDEIAIKLAEMECVR